MAQGGTKITPPKVDKKHAREVVTGIADDEPLHKKLRTAAGFEKYGDLCPAARGLKSVNEVNRIIDNAAPSYYAIYSTMMSLMKGTEFVTDLVRVCCEYAERTVSDEVIQELVSAAIDYTVRMKRLQPQIFITVDHSERSPWSRILADSTVYAKASSLGLQIVARATYRPSVKEPRLAVITFYNGNATFLFPINPSELPPDFETFYQRPALSLSSYFAKE